MWPSALCVLATATLGFQDAETPAVANRGARPVGQVQSELSLDYTARHAIVIGIDRYDDGSFPHLSYAVADAKSVAEILIEKFGFEKSEVHLLLNADATRDAIDAALQEWACNKKRIGANDLVVVFFAGHGVTREGATKQRGYLVPSDARMGKEEPAWSTLFGMDEIGTLSDFIPAKHAAFIFDCCFGGLAAMRAMPPIAAGLTLPARQVLTGGTEHQTVQDGGGGGHSVFTAALLDGWRGLADGNADKVITFGELYEYVNKRVQAETAQKQTPTQGNISGHDGGNVAFYPPGVAPAKMTAVERLAQLEQDKVQLLAENELLDNAIRVETLEKDASTLWPRRPATIPRLRTWLGQAKEVRSRLPVHEAALQHIQQEAFLSQVVAGTIEEKDSSEVDWDRADPRLQRRHRQFSDLVLHVRALDGLMADIESRLEIASTIEQKTIDEEADAWNECTEAIGKSALYHGLELEPQMGLVPLGEDPDSKLWEFWVWESGERPERDATTKRWKITGKTGIVLVLLVGGTFSMGSQKDIPIAANYDPLANVDQSPLHPVTLAPFFLAKYEMTQGQWCHVTGHNPSYWKHTGEPNAAAHPVEQVSYEDCAQIIARMEFVLPTEAQWEYGARGGTTAPWWTGSAKETLKQAGNLADNSYRKGFTAPFPSESWDDGYRDLAPVGSFRANGFGLHDTVGNVGEWCRDWWGQYTLPVTPEDGERMVPVGGARYRVRRGGCFADTAVNARSACRLNAAPENRGNLGCRVAKTICH